VIARIPTVLGIQRTSVIAGLVVAALLWWLDSTAAAIACVLGALLMILNFFALAGVARLILAAGRGTAPSGLAMLAAPLKLLLTIGLLCLLLSQYRIDLAGFAVGAASQLAAIVVETGRLAISGAARQG
jgi:hypothetical protein